MRTKNTESKNQSKVGMSHSSDAVYVAHRIGQNESRLPKFNTYLAKRIGDMASMKTMNSMHLTIMTMTKIRHILEIKYPGEHIMDRCAAELEEELISSTGKRETSVSVDRSRPLATMGRNNNILCLMLIADPILTEQRRVTESYFSRVLGNDMRPTLPFIPHIALGQVDEPTFPRRLRKEPQSVVPKFGMIPRTVALDGIECFVGRIHEQEHIL